MLKVNDDLLELSTTRVETSPAFIEASVEPHETAKKPGVYRLRVRIPPSGRPGNYQGDRQGKIMVTFDHPRIKSLELGIEFVVLRGSHERLSVSGRAKPGGS